MPSAVAAQHAAWLSLLETSGPFLTLPVLKRALPQGLEPTPPDLARRARAAFGEWQTDPGVHGRWVRWVLAEVLDLDEQLLVEGPGIPQPLAHRVGEHGVTLRPDLVVSEPPQPGVTPTPRLLIQVLAPGVKPDRKAAGDRWSATPLERMAELLRATGVRLGLVTNGDTWTLVDALRGHPTAYVTWDAAVWLEERITLDAFRTLLGAPRFFAVQQENTLEALLAESADAEEEVTGRLGAQVRQAVELLVDAFSRADRDEGGRLLEGVTPEQLYLATVTVLMRLVFLLSAEERGLFLLGDPTYDQAYAVSTLRAELQENADRHGEEPLEYRSSAWHRLLATFRMVHGGVQHEDLRLPAYGGSLFDPDRFPFLEGRPPGGTWKTDPGQPLPVDDRTMLHVLDALQVLRFTDRGVTEARRLSFRALDVEKIGHVYEGLLDHTAVRAAGPALGLRGKHQPEVAAEDIVAYDTAGRGALVDWVTEQSGLTRRQTEKALEADLEPEQRALLVAACDNDETLADRVAPYHGLVRRDLRDVPQVFLPGGVYVTQGSERRTSGTYYTPRTLAEEMVRHALEPLVYQPGPAEGADPAEWRLRPAGELLDLRVCDMAMGSGAFLVAACRYLSDRLLEAWQTAEADAGGPVTINGQPAGDAPETDLVPPAAEDRLMLARRVVADRCLFGVDKNPMAVEMAKLSMWLITLAKDRPFGFLDHALRCGDSLVGITDLAQLEHLHIDPDRGRALHHGRLFDYQATWAPVIKEAIAKRRRLESFPVVTVRDAQEKARLHREAEHALEALRVVGDVVTGAALSRAKQGDDMLDGRPGRGHLQPEHARCRADRLRQVVAGQVLPASPARLRPRSRRRLPEAARIRRPRPRLRRHPAANCPRVTAAAQPAGRTGRCRRRRPDRPAS